MKRRSTLRGEKIINLPSAKQFTRLHLINMNNYLRALTTATSIGKANIIKMENK
jgi:hypothetical protein